MSKQVIIACVVVNYNSITNIINCYLLFYLYIMCSACWTGLKMCEFHVYKLCMCMGRFPYLKPIILFLQLTVLLNMKIVAMQRYICSHLS